MAFEREEIIRTFNDAFRLSTGGQFVYSPGFVQLGVQQIKLLMAISESTTYCGTEEQQRLHERGTATVKDITAIWEFQYLDKRDQPTDPASTDLPFEKRRLYIKLADET